MNHVTGYVLAILLAIFLAFPNCFFYNVFHVNNVLIIEQKLFFINNGKATWPKNCGQVNLMKGDLKLITRSVQGGQKYVGIGIIYKKCYKLPYLNMEFKLKEFCLRDCNMY